MSTGSPEQVVKISAASRDALETLADNLNAPATRLGKVKKTTRITELGLDPLAVAATGYEVVALIANIGGAIQLVDWALKKINSFKSPKDTIIIAVGEETIAVTGVDDIEKLRRILGIDTAPKLTV